MNIQPELNLVVDSKPKEKKYSDYIVYVDESGDHNLTNTDNQYPVFVLAFCIFDKRHYVNQIVPSVMDFKFKHFGHDLVVLHENEIRKRKNEYSFLRHKAAFDFFIEELSLIINKSNFILISCVIDKKRIDKRKANSLNAYHIALKVCLEKTYEFLEEKKQQTLQTHVIMECRGASEDNAAELEFRRICDKDNKHEIHLPFEPKLYSKKANSTGLQFADMVARPIGLNYIRPNQKNRAFDILTDKFLCKGGREKLGVDFEGYGLNIYPPL